MADIVKKFRRFRKPLFKPGPFVVEKLGDTWATYLSCIAKYLSSLDHLPDFSEDESVMVFSDYSGDHAGAKFSTYSFLFIAGEKSWSFAARSKEFRQKFKMGNKEISFKRLRDGVIGRSIKDFLNLVDNGIHGVMFTVAIDNSIQTVFGENKKDAQAVLNNVADIIGEGDWHPSKLERMYRIYCPLLLVLDLVSANWQKVFWQSDTDSINEDGNKANFAHAQIHFARFMREFTNKDYPLLGFAKTFKEGGHFTDLLSVADLAAGMTQELLAHQYFGGDSDLGPEKVQVCKWLARESRFLQKLTLAVVRRGDSIHFDPISITPVAGAEAL